jgi:hypothetical protein
MDAGERRARLAARHRLGAKSSDATRATRALVALHSTDPATPYLSLRARVREFETADLDRALLDDRTLWRLHAMRRTLFVVPTGEAWIFEAAASRDVAARERRRLEGWLAAQMPADGVGRFVARLESLVMGVLGDGVERRTQDLTVEVPGLATEIVLGSGPWATRAPLSSRLLFLMAMDGRIVRTRPAGSWRSSQYHWARADAWFGEPPPRADPRPARTELARRYLAAYGPATMEDLRWWTGWTAKQAAAAIQAAGAATVHLDDGTAGLALADDLEPTPSPEPPPVALLPALDPTPMGWKRRDWFLGDHAGRLFDRNGNIGPSVWLGGRIVGGWAQRPEGGVVVEMLQDVGTEARRRIRAEAESLTRWLAGAVVVPRFRTPLERELAKR